MRIAIDIDDTLSKVDRLAGTVPYITKNKLPFTLRNAEAHVLQEMYDWTREDVTKFIQSGGVEVFTKAPLREGAREVLQNWKAAGHEIVILTARINEWFQDPEKVSRAWLDENQVPYDEVVANVWEKGEYCKAHGIEVLIEDNFEICKKAQELGVKAVMFVDRHNLVHAKKITYAGASWERIASAVEFILNPPRARY